ncbi:efflux RND transporter periplasmic adaptor subunit [Putridiphycobacter roseus]|uniref:Efflux RND transporter periplasmic adaptor subunit n=1 Tax=Putridiphycobacter roseus TaxID=2219161 RepID=A0A2W1MZ01_9FLAO|nr:efflux RND transporter periplasmic adaptor subunit [Putridiphycobacter roseus]PZE17117.1 efflux RND transporter periplasmic adaptor subunit [Putridiphycobacter roseus]
MKTIKYIMPALILSVFLACTSENTPDMENVERSNMSDLLEISNAQFELGKMALGTFSNQTFYQVVKANGMLDVPPEYKSTVSAYFGGYVKNIALIQGQKVRKGQTLFTLESPDYIEVQESFLAAKSQLSYLKSDYERQKDLAASNVTSQKIYLKAESDYLSTLAKYESLKKRLQLMNINPNTVTALNLSSTIAVKAPMAGFVTSVLATKGMFLNPSDIAVTIMNTDHMHIELNIFEQDLSTISIGQDVLFSLQNGHTNYKATVHLINKAIDSDTRTIKVHCHFKNEKDAVALTPGMYVSAEIYSGVDTALSLPLNAVVSIENKSFVLVQKEFNGDLYSFKKVAVQLGKTERDFVEILNVNDFEDGAQFLINGAFNLIKD